MRLALAVTVKYSVSTSPFFHMRLHIDTMPSRGASFEGAGCKDRAISAYVSFAACPCFIDLCCVSLFNEIKCLIGSILLYVLVNFFQLERFIYKLKYRCLVILISGIQTLYISVIFWTVYMIILNLYRQVQIITNVDSMQVLSISIAG
jgi:hypothetical protein